MVDRLKAAVDARADGEFVIMARTDAHAVEGQSAALERAAAYSQAGADMIFAEALQTLEEYRQFAASLEVPVLANITEFGQTPLFSTRGARRRGRAPGAVSAVRLSRRRQGCGHGLPARSAGTARRRACSI